MRCCRPVLDLDIFFSVGLSCNRVVVNEKVQQFVSGLCFETMRIQPQSLSTIVVVQFSVIWKTCQGFVCVELCSSRNKSLSRERKQPTFILSVYSCPR